MKPSKLINKAIQILFYAICIGVVFNGVRLALLGQFEGVANLLWIWGAGIICFVFACVFLPDIIERADKEWENANKDN